MEKNLIHIMMKIFHSVAILALMAGLASCNTDPSSPGGGGSLVLTTFPDSTPVEVSGTWRLAFPAPTGITLALSSQGAKFSFDGNVEHRGNVQKGRSLAVKFYGRETSRSLYEIVPDNENQNCNCKNTRLEFMLQNSDSLLVSQCEQTPALAKFHGWYVRER